MNTTDRVRVTIDLTRVASNLRTEDGTGASERHARSFLHHAGFNPAEDGTWICPRDHLCRLNHSEVVGVEPMGR